MKQLKTKLVDALQKANEVMEDQQEEEENERQARLAMDQLDLDLDVGEKVLDEHLGKMFEYY